MSPKNKAFREDAKPDHMSVYQERQLDETECIAFAMPSCKWRWCEVAGGSFHWVALVTEYCGKLCFMLAWLFSMLKEGFGRPGLFDELFNAS